jgi:hypothetical protein
MPIKGIKKALQNRQNKNSGRKAGKNAFSQPNPSNPNWGPGTPSTPTANPNHAHKQEMAKIRNRKREIYAGTYVKGKLIKEGGSSVRSVNANYQSNKTTQSNESGGTTSTESKMVSGGFEYY